MVKFDIKSGRFASACIKVAKNYNFNSRLSAYYSMRLKSTIFVLLVSLSTI